MQKKEFGGYLPLETGSGQGYYHFSDHDMRFYNCGRTAIHEACRNLSVSEIYIPYYICQTVTNVAEDLGIRVIRYHVNQEFEPVFDFPQNAAVLLVNYFGLKDTFIQDLANQFEAVILDHTQAFFCPPVLREGVSNIYSCRKFIGVPDGGYLIEKNCRAEQLPAGESWPYYTFLCKAKEIGTNAAYQESLDSEHRLHVKEGMSKLTKQVLRGVDYNYIMTARRQNYQILDALLGEKNRLHLDLGKCVPYLYPYWVKKGSGERVRTELIRRCIYIPTLWKECCAICASGTLEYQWSKDLICLPIDQRYEKDDMEYLVGVISEIEGSE